MDRWISTARKKLRHGESQKGEDKRWRRPEREKVRREKMQVAKGRKVDKHCVFPMFCGSGGSVALEGRKVSSLKRHMWSQLAR